MRLSIEVGRKWQADANAFKCIHILNSLRMSIDTDD